jgi:hypothetical protein
MGPIEISLLALFLFGSYTTYRIKTMQMAIEKREAMIGIVKDIVSDPTASIEFKKVAIGLFHLSIIPSSLPSLIYYVVKHRKDPKKISLSLNSDHQQKFEKLLNEHFFKINVLCAPHYYVLLFISFFLLVLVVAPISMWRRYVTSLQEKAFDPACMVAVKY